MLGKWHLGGTFPNATELRRYDPNARSAFDLLPTARGFDHHYGHLTSDVGGWDHTYNGKGLPCGLDWRRNNHSLPEERGTFGTADGFTAHLLVRELARLLAARAASSGRADDDDGGSADESPLFVYLPFHMVHDPIEAPAEYVGKATERRPQKGTVARASFSPNAPPLPVTAVDRCCAGHVRPSTRSHVPPPSRSRLAADEFVWRVVLGGGGSSCAMHAQVRRSFQARARRDAPHQGGHARRARRGRAQHDAPLPRARALGRHVRGGGGRVAGSAGGGGGGHKHCEEGTDRGVGGGGAWGQEVGI